MGYRPPTLAGPLPPPAIGPPITLAPPAVQARARKNQGIDAKRREGTAARHALAQAKPPMAADKPPQMAAPSGAVPQETAPQFTPAQYVPPKKGLEYLALGLGVLFPGSGIARLATGFAGGLQAGAEKSYDRREKQATQQYDAAKTQADTDYQNKAAVYADAQTRTKIAFENAQIVWKNGQDLRARGINPLTNQPFKYPPLAAAAGGKTTVEASMAGYDRLIQLAQRNGDDGAAVRFAKARDEYQARVIQQQKDLTEMTKTAYTQQQENDRHADTESQENQRAVYREDSRFDRHEREQRENVRQNGLTAYQKVQLGDKAAHDFRMFTADYLKLTKPGKPDDNNPQGTPAPIADRDALNKNLAIIAKASDPAEQAARFMDQTDDPNLQSLMGQYGEISTVRRQAAGLPITPLPPMKVPKTPMVALPGVPHDIAVNIRKLPQQAQDSISQGLASGQTLDDIRATAAQHGLTDVLRALGHAAPPAPDAFHSADFSNSTGL